MGFQSMAGDSQPARGRSLNPHAMPYQASAELPHEIYGRSSQLPPQPPAAVGHGVPYLYHQYCTPAWKYPEAIAAYNVCRQPQALPSSYSVPCYISSGSRGFECYCTNTQPQPAYFGTNYPRHDHQMGGTTVPNFRVLGCGEKRVGYKGGRRVIAPRQRSQRRGGEGMEERAWVPKKVDEKNGDGGVLHASIISRERNALKGKTSLMISNIPNQFEYKSVLRGTTSLMIRNIPNQFERHDMLQILDDHCLNENSKAKLCSDPVKSEYDFFYLPMDFRRCANLGYGFVNFTNAIAALRFYNAFHKFKWEVAENKKICEVTSAIIQGKNALIDHFKKSIFPCHTNGYLPVILSPPRDGTNSSEPVPVGRLVNTPLSPSTKALINQRMKC